MNIKRGASSAFLISILAGSFCTANSDEFTMSYPRAFPWFSDDTFISDSEAFKWTGLAVLDADGIIERATDLLLIQHPELRSAKLLPWYISLVYDYEPGNSHELTVLILDISSIDSGALIASDTPDYRIKIPRDARKERRKTIEPKARKISWGKLAYLDPHKAMDRATKRLLEEFPELTREGIRPLVVKVGYEPGSKIYPGLQVVVVDSFSTVPDDPRSYPDSVWYRTVIFPPVGSKKSITVESFTGGNPDFDQ